MTSQVLNDLVSLLSLEQIEINIFRGKQDETRPHHVFGGLVMGQALMAAMRTVDEVASGRVPHSIQCYFLRAGDPKIPILYDVDRIRDGKSFTTRRVVAIQHGKAIFNMAVSFQIEEDGFEHQASMPTQPGPDSLAAMSETQQRLAQRYPEQYSFSLGDQPIEIRRVEDHDPIKPKVSEASAHIWMKTSAVLADDTVLHRSMLAYMSDMNFMGTSALPHGISMWDKKVQGASLDHTMWFHRPFRADQWLLYAQDSPNAGGARGFVRGQFFTEQGVLVASTAQECLIRVWD